MRLTVWLCVVVLLVMLSCSDKRKIPAGVLSMEKMEAVLTDILIADALNVERCARDTSLKLQAENASYFLKIYKMHKIDTAVFNKSYDFYLRRPDMLKEISDTVIAVLNRKNLQPINSTDSIQKKIHGNNVTQTPR